MGILVLFTGILVLLPVRYAFGAPPPRGESDQLPPLLKARCRRGKNTGTFTTVNLHLLQTTAPYGVRHDAGFLFPQTDYFKMSLTHTPSPVYKYSPPPSWV
ncbi:hypothetical protein AAFF_G00253100 [Aldrovandia affinis]|uniref:Secreted protein n=1 Tax=Aldrovandia affinis TaxID=143900 RepID=A0AAD7WTQ9_9TELE|nr:hypothetical protein AAFF_G00253100 [Aldrovandia affinis]